MSSLGTYNTKTITNTGVSTPKINFNNNFTNYEGDTENVNNTKNESLDLSDFLDIDEIDVTESINAIKDTLSETVETISGAVASTAATVAVGATSVVSGVLDVGESIVDGGAWLASKVVGLFNKDAANSIKEFIATDHVSELNESFYENTELGKSINNASYMKYDSEAAQGIRNVTETATEFAAATALTVATGGVAGAALTAGVGALSGLGTAAESTYQTNGTDTTLLQEGGIALSGALTGMSWMANGSLGSGALSIGKDIANLGAKEVLSKISKEVLTTDFVKESLKKGLASKQAIMNYVGAAMMTGESAVPYITGEEEFTATAALKIAGKFTISLVANVIEDSLTDYIRDYKSIDKFAERLEIITKGADKDATDRQIPIALLLSLIQDPKYDDALMNGSLTDELEGFTLMELGNGLKDLSEAAAKNGIDLGLDDASLNRLNKYIDKLAISQDDYLSQEIISLYSNMITPSYIIKDPDTGIERLPAEAETIAYNCTADYFNTEDGQKLIKYVRDIDTSNQSDKISKIKNYTLIMYENALNSIDADSITNQNFFQDYVSNILSQTSSSISDKDIQAIQEAIAQGKFELTPSQSKIYEQILRRIELDGYDQEVRLRLQEFAGASVSEGKAASIIGSIEYKTDSEYRDLAKNPNWMGFNNGTKSVVDLNYETNIIKNTVNHESLHQISHSDINYDSITGKRISLAGVEMSIYNQLTQNWDSKRKGINESITEFFNKLTMGSEYTNSSGYFRGVNALQSLVDGGFISVDSLKKYYFTNDGDGLVKYFDDICTKYGLKYTGEEIMKMFDNAATGETWDIQEMGAKQLSKFLKQLWMELS